MRGENLDTRSILEKIKLGQLSVDKAEQMLRRQPFEEMGFATLDTHRKLRSRFVEVIFCSGKTDEHLLHIVEKLYEEEGEVFGTRASLHQYELLKQTYELIQYDPISKIIKIEKEEKIRTGNIVVCTAGTADITVAEEAAQTAEYFGSYVE